MDVVTKALLKEFSDSQEIASPDDVLRFEMFANFCAVSQHYSDNFDVSNCSTGSFQGIDGIAVLANGAFIDSEDTIQELVDTNGYLSASFVFIQSKTSSSFDLGDMSKFSNAVVGFFEDNPHFVNDPLISAFVTLKNAVYAQSSKFKRGNPQVHLYYVTTGGWDEPAALRAHIEDTKNRLKSLNIFSSVEFEPVDARLLQEWYRQTQTSRTVQIEFEKSIALPSIPKVEQAHLGALRGTEFLKLLDDGSGQLVRSIFYENIRDYQRGSVVNEKIASTLKDGRETEFVLRNNGVTVVASNLGRTGDIFTIKDYQIVNGCKTSNVLFDNRELVGENTYIPVKIIVTNDEDVRSQVIVSSNSQNKVTDEQLWALEGFQKQLELYFQSVPEADKLFYERRSRQYDAVPNVERARIVSPNDLVRSFASMYLNEPHVAGRYFKELTGHIAKGQMFNPSHKISPYYAAAYSAYRLAWLFRNRGIDSKFKNFRFHGLLAFKLIVSGDERPALNSRDAEKQATKIVEVLHDPDKSEAIFRSAFDVIDKAVQEAGGTYARDTARYQTFRDRVTELALEHAKTSMQP